MVDIVVHGKAMSNLVQDIDQSVMLADHCRDVILQCIDLYSNYQTSASCEMLSLHGCQHRWCPFASSVCIDRLRETLE